MKIALATLGVVLLLALGVKVFLHTYEKKSTEQWTGYQGEARYNEFLAAQIILDKLDTEADSRRALRPDKWLPPTSDTLLARLSPDFAVGYGADLIVDWVGDGGHLILLPPLAASQNLDDFLARFELRYVAAEEQDESADEPTDSSEDATDDYTYTLQINRNPLHIETTAEDAHMATVRDDTGINILRQPWGDGYLTVLSDGSYFSNPNLEDYDHARLLMDIVSGYLVSGKVWFIYSAEFTPLWRILWNTAKYLLLGLSLMFLLWLWSRVPRFGPMAAVTANTRRSIVEHITATGEFGWRQQGSAALARASVNAVIHTAERLHPGIGRLTKEQQAEVIARLSDQPPQDILDALLVVQETRAREFTHQIQFLQTIRNEL